MFDLKFRDCKIDKERALANSINHVEQFASQGNPRHRLVYASRGSWRDSRST